MITSDKKNKINKEGVNIIRTYTSDMAEAIKTDEASVIKIALAEKRKKENQELIEKVEGTKSEKIFWFIAGIIFIFLTIFISIYSIEKKKEKNTPTPITQNIESYISYDGHTYIDVAGYFDPDEIFNLIKTEADKKDITGKIKIFSLIKKIDGIISPLTTNDFFSLVKAETPPILIKSLDENFTIGGYYPKQTIDNLGSQQEKNNIFFVFKINDYNQVYAAILEWEKTMLEDLHNLFDIEINENNKNLIGKKWKDVVVNNRDIRVIYDFDESGLIYYTFVDKDYLIISNNTETLNEISFRLIYGNK